MQVLDQKKTANSFEFLTTSLYPLVQGLKKPLTKQYWFAPGCRLSYQFTKYVIALLYLYLANIWIGYFTPKVYLDFSLSYLNPEMYRPLGIMALFGNTPPPRVFYEISFLLLKICPITLLLGFFSRISLAGCMCGLFGLSIFEYGFSLEWSHGFSPILVTSLALLLGPRYNDGFDGWLRRRMGKPWSVTDDCRARAAVLSVQLMISLIFLNAAFYKCYAYGDGWSYFFPWVFSDNLRNIIIRQHVLFDVPINEPYRYIVTHAFAYKGLALGNMLAQIFPFFAIFFMKRPVLRLLCGLPLVLEVLGLGIIMGIWNLHWLLFIFFFVDWDRLVFRKKKPFFNCPIKNRSLFIHGLLLSTLIAFNGLIMFTHMRQQAWTFPFTSYPMFSFVVAEKPLNQHHHFYIPVSRFEFASELPLSPDLIKSNWVINWGMMWIADTRQANKQIMDRFEMSHGCPIPEMKAYRALLRIEKYPSCELHEINKYLVYHYQKGHVRTVTSMVIYDTEKIKRYIDFQAFGFENPEIAIKYVTEEDHTPSPLPGVYSDKRFYFEQPEARKVMVLFEIKEPNKPPVFFAGPLL
jgi:hypothetical protein